MSRKSKTAIHGPPLTVKEATGHGLSSYDAEAGKSRPIACAICGKEGGTLVGRGDGYVHPRCLEAPGRDLRTERQLDDLKAMREAGRAK